MTEIIHPTTVTYHGPFIIDFEHLKRLDEIFNEEWDALVCYREQMVSEEVDKQIAELTAEGRDADRKQIDDRVRAYYRFSTQSREVYVLFKSGKHAKGKTFADIAQTPDVKGEYPTAFRATMASADALASISSDSSISGTKLKMEVKPFGEVTRSIQFKLERWIRDVSPSQWQKVWCKTTSFLPVQWFLVIIAFLIMFGSVSTSLKAHERALQSFKKELRNEAHSLLAEGVSSNDITRVLELDLKLASDYLPKDYDIGPVVYHKWPFILMGITFIFSLLASFRPNLHLAIGKGELSAKRWKIWLNLLSITFPGLIITGIIIPVVVDKFFL